MILIRNLRLGTDEAIGALPEKAAKKLRIAPERMPSRRRFALNSFTRCTTSKSLARPEIP